MDLFTILAFVNAVGQPGAVTLPDLNPWQVAVTVFTFLSPNIIAFIQQPNWPTKARIGMFAAFHFVTAAIFLGAAGKLDVTNWVGTGVTLCTFAAGAYVGIWKPFADKIEIKTTKALRKLQGKEHEPVRMTSASNASPFPTGRPKRYELMDNMYL